MIPGICVLKNARVSKQNHDHKAIEGTYIFEKDTKPFVTVAFDHLPLKIGTTFLYG